MKKVILTAVDENKMILVLEDETVVEPEYTAVHQDFAITGFRTSDRYTAKINQPGGYTIDIFKDNKKISTENL